MEEIIKETSENTISADSVNALPKEKKSSDRIKTDKLIALKAKHEKAVKALEKAECKAKAVEAEIAAEEKKRHDKDIKRLDGLCSKLNIEFADVISFIELITENNLNLNEVAELIGTK